MEQAVMSVPADVPRAPGVRWGVTRRALSGRLGRAGRVTQVSAPAGSGKTFLLRSWIGEAGLADSAAWVSVQPEERDAQRFWLSVLDALRLLEVLLMRAPAGLRFVLVTRHDLRLGLHRLRLEGGLTEIRAGDLRFTLDEARELFAAARVGVSDSALARLVERTEGWAAGLRLAALSLAGHPDPARFTAEFSGSERTVAEYLLAEVLERQSEEVRRLLLRTSVLERVSGPVADYLTGGQDGERILQELEAVNAFVVSLDARRTWFRYHHLFAELLQLELRRTEPGELPALHRAAAGWFADHGYPAEAVRHAQAAENWSIAAWLLCDNWISLTLNGQQDTAHELLTGFPAGVASGDPELIALAAADELNRGSFEKAEVHLARATRGLASVPAERRERFQVALGILRLFLARQRGDLPTVAEEAERLLAPVEAANAADRAMSGERRALALISLGIAETWSSRSDEAERHLEQGVALAREIGRPYLELTGLAHAAQIAVVRSIVLREERSLQAIELAGRHGWSEEPIAGIAYAELAGTKLTQARLDEAERWLERAERTLRAELEPAAGVTLRHVRGGLELARGHPERALDAFQSADRRRLAERLLTPHMDAAPIRAQTLQVLVRLGQPERAEAALAQMDEQLRDTAVMRSAIAVLRLAGDDPRAATLALAPVIAGSGPAGHPTWLVEALLLEAVARDILGD